MHGSRYEGPDNVCVLQSVVWMQVPAASIIAIWNMEMADAKQLS